MLLLPLLVLPAGCGGGGGNSPGPTLVSISVTPANASIVTGGSQQLTATGTFSDGTTRDVSTQITSWSSSPTGVVRISVAGLVTSLGVTGSVTITAAIGTISAPPVTLTVTTGSTAGANVMTVSVNGSLCSSATSGNYFNKPCVSVTICNPGSSTCQTVNDILLDTGSYGLRIFNQALPGLTLTQTSSGSGALAECIQFADGSTIWGPVKIASVQLGSEPAVQIPIQVIDASFATPTSCGTPDATPAAAGYTGILGVGPLPQDCGPNCTTRARSGVYFSCTGTTCTGTTVALANQVPNPVWSLPIDNNGVQVQLPTVALGGVSSLTGSLILGIGTQTNNTPAVAPTVLPTNGSADFSTVYNGTSITSFLDTGSNALFFPSTFPSCTGANSPWYCPPSTVTQSATLVGSPGAPSKAVQFSVGNANALFATNHNVFFEIGGTSTFGFDWGLPFFMGKNVFFGISGTVSPGLGTGPFVAF